MANGNNIDNDLGLKIKTFSCQERIYDHASFTISCENDKKLKSVLSKSSKELIGKVINITVNYNERSFKFSGVILSFYLEQRRNRHIPLLVISGKSLSIILENGNQYQSFEKKTLKDICTALKSDNLFLKCSGTDNKKITVQQWDESDFNFIKRIAGNYGNNWVYYKTDTLYINNHPPQEKEIELGNSADLQINLNYITNQHQLIEQYNADENKTKISKETFKDRTRLLSFLSNSIGNKKSTLFLHASNPDLEKTRDSAEVIYKSVISTAYTLNGNSDIPMYLGNRIVGQYLNDLNIDITNVHEKTETFIVTGIQHYFDERTGIYSNSFEAIPDALETPLRHVMQFVTPLAFPADAIVVDIGSKENAGKVKVGYLVNWDFQSYQSSWIRVLSNYAGKGRGMLVMPEKDERVVVCFKDGHPDRPFIIGSHFHGKALPDVTGDNDIKQFKTRSGNEVTLIDKKDNEQIIIANKNSKNKIALNLSDSGNSIEIFSDGGTLKLKGKKIEIDADEQITLKSKKIDVT